MPVLQPLVGSTEAPQQHKQPSRKGKKAWRKNVDVTEVQEGLAEAIQEKILFGSRLRDKPAEELFAIDDVTSEAFKNQFPSRPIPKRKKTLKADEIINSRSAVPALPLRKRKHPGLGTTDGVLPEKRHRKDWVSHKELTRLRKVADGHHETTVAVKATTFDVWDAPESAKMTAGGEQLNFLPEIKKTKAPKSIKQKPVSLAANGKEIPAVIKPSGGYSYNPLADDYQQRYIEEWEKTKATEIARLKEEAADQAKQEAAAKSAAEAEAAEARADLSEWDEDTDWEGFESEGEGLKPNTKRPQRKNPAQRNRSKRRKEEERRQKHEARMRQRDAQAQRMKELLAEVAEKEAQKALVKVDESDSSEEGDDSVLRRRQLGKLKIPEKDMELVLPEEMEGSLRLLKPEGNLLKDRYRSMLVRGKLESRRHIPFKKQAKVKFTEKWTHKDFRL